MEGEKTLRDLIDRAFVRHHARYATDLANLARANDFKINRTTINEIRNGTYSARPGKPVLEALAWLAGVSLDAAYLAADLPAPGPPFAAELPDDVDRLDRKERDAVLHVVRVLLEHHRSKDATPVTDSQENGTFELRTAPGE